jgi:hypothetical protein
MGNRTPLGVADGAHEKDPVSRVLSKFVPWVVFLCRHGQRGDGCALGPEADLEPDGVDLEVIAHRGDVVVDAGDAIGQGGVLECLVAGGFDEREGCFGGEFAEDAEVGSDGGASLRGEPEAALDSPGGPSLSFLAGFFSTSGQFRL